VTCSTCWKEGCRRRGAWEEARTLEEEKEEERKMPSALFSASHWELPVLFFCCTLPAFLHSLCSGLPSKTPLTADIPCACGGI